MRTLDRYIFREVAVTCIAVTIVLLVILLSNQLARVLSQAAANDFPAAREMTESRRLNRLPSYANWEPGKPPEV